MNRISTIIYTAETAIPAFINTPEGAGPFSAIIFSNGYTAYHEMYDDMAEAFCRSGYLTLQYDQRGTAGARHGFQLCGTEWLDDAAAAVSYAYGMDEVDKDRIALTGVSMGGAMTLIQGARDERIKCLYAMAPYVNGELNYKKTFLEAHNGDLEAWKQYQKIMFEDAARVAHGFPSTNVPYGFSIFSGLTNPEVTESEKLARQKHPLKITSLPYASAYNTYMNVDSLEAARKINKPVLIVHGTGDSTLDYKNSYILLDAISCSEKELKLIPDAEHVLPEVACDEVTKYGLEFFKKYL